ncbi:MAG: hypothetical protein M3O67_04610 [Bacteroidota bacterium]|nr:hypothetical protein [Bacteroidota bacterium]
MIIQKTISKEALNYSFLFSICSIITDRKEYLLMKQSFEDSGFTGDCEFIMADNTGGNHFNAYEAILRFIQESQATYIVLVHQDIRCIDSKAQLLKCLNDLTITDNKWAVCGNAGCKGYHQDIIHINNAGTIIKSENLPTRVYSLDENLLIINKASGISISSNLSGFHLYGTDLCIIADFLGYTCYVIPFMVKHLSHGNLKDLDKHIKSFTNSYGKKIRSRYIQTTCTRFYLSNSVFKNKFYNFPLIFFFIKAIQRIKLLIQLLVKGNQHKKTKTYEKEIIVNS